VTCRPWLDGELDTHHNPDLVAGEEVVQLHINDLFASATRPVKELQGFGRIVLEVRETRTAEFELPVAALDLYGKDMRLTVERGAFKVTIRRSSRDIALEGDSEILP
jgi:beta-glucosidase